LGVPAKSCRQALQGFILVVFDYAHPPRTASLPFQSLTQKKITLNKSNISCYNILMTQIEQTQHAKEFAEYWKDKVAEKQESQLDLLLIT
jgi:hypothetical protein